MIKELTTDETLLSAPCERATADDAAVATDLVDTLASLEEAACLAANQIGELKAIIAFKDARDQIRVLYNPRLLMGIGATALEEACLTHPETTVQKRYLKIQLSYEQLVDGELKPFKRRYEGWEAQMIQHMMDHCAGKHL